MSDRHVPGSDDRIGASDGRVQWHGDRTRGVTPVLTTVEEENGK
jgi:hypothetical protein